MIGFRRCSPHFELKVHIVREEEDSWMVAVSTRQPLMSVDPTLTSEMLCNVLISPKQGSLFLPC